MDDDYFEGLTSIINYFDANYDQVISDPLIVPYTHFVYSSYLNEIIRRILDDTITVVNTNNDEALVNQLYEYDYLRKFDTVLGNDKIDLRFVDVFPGYLAQVSTDDLDKYLFINRLVKIVLGSDAISDGSIVYTGR